MNSELIYKLFEATCYRDADAFEEICEEMDVQSVRTFQDAGILTNDEGLVVQLQNGESFQLTVVKA